MNLSTIKVVLFIIATFIILQLKGQEKMNFEQLTPEEKKVIIEKGTEAPFTGQYNKHSEKGTYTCRQCGTALFRSGDKFDSECGWPSFDDEINDAVKRIADADGRRTEIVCANCNGHLGHVFTGEGFTSKNLRHCVNSISMDFMPAPDTEKPITEVAIFASGCFWGTEYYFKKAKGVVSTTVGYIGGHVQNPDYEQVCTGETGHAEAVKVVFDPLVTTYEKLAKLFFETHDFSQVNGQGPDIGEQYRSVVFHTGGEQKQITEKLIRELTQKGFKVATTVQQAGEFYEAEKHHQNYYFKTGGTPYCHIKRKVF